MTQKGFFTTTTFDLQVKQAVSIREWILRYPQNMKHKDLLGENFSKGRDSRADHGGFKFIAYVLTILWHIYSSLINTVPFRPTLRGLWPVTTTKRWASLRLPSGSVTGPNSLRNFHFWKDFDPKSPEDIMSQALEGDVTHDKRTNSSLQNALWPVTEELVEIVQYEMFIYPSAYLYISY